MNCPHCTSQSTKEQKPRKPRLATAPFTAQLASDASMNEAGRPSIFWNIPPISFCSSCVFRLRYKLSLRESF